MPSDNCYIVEPMPAVSAYLLAKRLERELNGLLATLDIYSLAAEPRQLVRSLRTGMADARLDIRDYELAETRTEQLRLRDGAVTRLDTVRKCMLAGSEHNIFSAVEVVQLSAHLERLKDCLV